MHVEHHGNKWVLSMLYLVHFSVLISFLKQKTMVQTNTNSGAYSRLARVPNQADENIHSVDEECHNTQIIFGLWWHLPFREEHQISGGK